MKLLVLTFALLGIHQAVWGFYADDAGILELDPSTFEEKVPGSGLWLVEFYAPWCGHCKNLAPIWKDVGKALRGIINTAAIDADTYKDVAAKLDIKGFPSVKLITGSTASSLKAVEYAGDRSASGIVEWALREAKKIALTRIGARSGREGGKKRGSQDTAGGFYGDDSDVISLTDANFHEEVEGDTLWMVEFYAPWCGHCKNLKSDWEELATNVKGKAKIGAVDCTVQKATCQEFGIQGFPTIKFFGEDKDSPTDYQGGRESSSLTNFIMAHWKKSQPPPEAKQLVDQHVFEKECVGAEEEAAKKLCLLAFLPDILDTKAAGRLAYIKIMNSLGDKYADRPFSYLWLEGGAQTKLEKALGVGGYGYPAFVAVSPKEGKYASLREAFDTANALHFVESLRSGRERVSSVEGGIIPDIVTTPPWDGGDGQLLEEEEFSLEDLMGDDEDQKSEL